MKHYDLTYLIVTDTKTEDIEKLNSDLTELILKQGGTVTKIQGPHPKTLGYEIKKQLSALEVGIEFDLEGDKLKEVEDRVKKQNLLRYMLVVKKIQKEEPRRMFEPPVAETPVTESPIKEERREEKKVELKDIDEKLEEILKE